MTVVGATLFFSASDGSNGRELWKTDGSGVGTLMVADLTLGGSTTLNWLQQVGTRLVFFADGILAQFEGYSELQERENCLLVTMHGNRKATNNRLSFNKREISTVGDLTVEPPHRIGLFSQTQRQRSRRRHVHHDEYFPGGARRL